MGIKVKYNTQATYVYINVLTSSMSFPCLLHFLNKTKKYNTANTKNLLSISWQISYHFLRATHNISARVIQRSAHSTQIGSSVSIFWHELPEAFPG